MEVRYRDTSLRYPRAIRDEKIMLVLEWLLEFRFSSLDVLAERIGQSKVNSNRFFRGIIDDGLIQVFSNVHTKHHRYVLLTSAGVSYLEAAGHDVSSAVIRPGWLGRYSRVIHDISMQTVLVRRLDDFSEIIYERNLDMATQERPDAICITRQKGYRIAFEFERWRKDRKRIYHTFVSHAKALVGKEYQGVYYLFESRADRDHYQALFDEAKWPVWNRQPKTGKMVRAAQAEFDPDAVSNLRDVFKFLHEPAFSEPGPVAVEAELN